MRVLVEYILYVREWYSRYNEVWPRSSFRSSVSFESFFGAAPSLMVQTFVLLFNEEDASLLQQGCFVFSTMSATIHLMSYFTYLHVSNNTYVLMVMKAIVNSSLRTYLVAKLVDELEAALTVICVAGSFCLGVGLYYLLHLEARKKDREDPFERTLPHAALAVLTGLLSLFVSFPFSPTYPVQDWWKGYIYYELKIQLENAAIGCLFLLVVVEDFALSNATSIGLIIFGASQLAINIVLLTYLHKSVMRQLAACDTHTTKLINELWFHICNHIEGRGEEMKPLSRGAGRALKTNSIVPLARVGTDNEIDMRGKEGDNDNADDSGSGGGESSDGDGGGDRDTDEGKEIDGNISDHNDGESGSSSDGNTDCGDKDETNKNVGTARQTPRLAHSDEDGHSHDNDDESEGSITDSDARHDSQRSANDDYVLEMWGDDDSNDSARKGTKAPPNTLKVPRKTTRRSRGGSNDDSDNDSEGSGSRSIDTSRSPSLSKRSLSSRGSDRSASGSRSSKDGSRNGSKSNSRSNSRNGRRKSPDVPFRVSGGGMRSPNRRGRPHNKNRHEDDRDTDNDRDKGGGAGAVQIRISYGDTGGEDENSADKDDDSDDEMVNFKVSNFRTNERKRGGDRDQDDRDDRDDRGAGGKSGENKLDEVLRKLQEEDTDSFDSDDDMFVIRKK